MVRLLLLGWGIAGVVVAGGCSSQKEAEPCEGASCEMDAGATPDAGPGDPDAGPMDPDTGRVRTDAGGPGESRFYALQVLDLGAPDPAGDPEIVPGFDLDGRVSDTTDNETCRKQDFTSPPPDSEMGVDNQLGPILSEQEEMFHIRQNLRNSLADGRLIVLIEVSDIHDFENDDWVVVDFMFGVLPAGVAAPMVDASGRILPGQTFDVQASSLDADMMTPLIRFDGAQIIDGRVSTGAADFAIAIPYDMDTDFELDIKRSRTRFDIADTTLARGVLGGSLRVDETAAAIAAADPEMFDEDLVRLVLESAADLDRDAAADCTSVSVAMVFDAVSAVRGVVRAM